MHNLYLTRNWLVKKSCNQHSHIDKVQTMQSVAKFKKKTLEDTLRAAVSLSKYINSFAFFIISRHCARIVYIIPSRRQGPIVFSRSMKIRRRKSTWYQQSWYWLNCPRILRPHLKMGYSKHFVNLPQSSVAMILVHHVENRLFLCISYTNLLYVYSTQSITLRSLERAFVLKRKSLHLLDIRVVYQ